MKNTRRYSGWATCAMIVLASGFLMVACDSTPNNGGGNGNEYNLVVVLEKNLDSGQDIIFVKFTRDGDGIDDGVVVIDNDTIATSSVSGKGSKSYSTPRWEHSEKIQIAAIDEVESFIYRDSVVIPDEFVIEGVIPANHIWRPSDGNANVSWTVSIAATNYLVSVDSRNQSLNPVGFADYSQSQSGLAQEIVPTTFRDAFGNLVEDIYDIRVIAYSRNFIFRDNTPYKLPMTEDIRTPIINDHVDGAISALVVADRDTLSVETQ